MSFSPAPLDADKCTSLEWLSVALSQGLGRPVRLTGREILESKGPSALKIRMRVETEGDRGDLPEQVCLKGVFDPELSTWLKSGAQQAEAFFYRDIASRLSVRVPRCFYAGYDGKTGAGHIIMEDLVPQGVTFLSAISPYSVEQMRGSLDQLARLHGGTWNADPAAQPWVRSKLAQFADGSIMPPEALGALMADGRAEGLPDRLRDGTAIFDALRALSDREADLPLGFIHGDCHAGNVFEGPEGIGLIDWQVLQRGHWSLDVAYHIAAALEIADRREHERDLLRHYCDRLAQHGGEPLDFEAAFAAYRAAFPYGLLLWGITRRVEPAIVHRFVQRLGTAAADHDSLGLLGV
ncbi:hypothetical protein JI59_12590 [Novosphingobium pentaromativorans US6-1]|nr:hypothetical protein JI59_12590 [Novosphingobium pentaromativorans US6-1]